LNKKILASLGLLFAANGAFAQTASSGSSVELYGIIDLAVGHVEHSLNTSPDYGNTISPVTAAKTTVSNGVNGMINGGIQGSRWGIRGTEDLGDGLKAFFTLESGFNAQDGSLSNGAASLASNSPKATGVSSNSSLDGQLFNRQAFVGLSDGAAGSLALGRNYNPIYEVVTDYAGRIEHHRRRRRRFGKYPRRRQPAVQEFGWPGQVRRVVQARRRGRQHLSRFRLCPEPRL